jgi:hypothetical protein
MALFGPFTNAYLTVNAVDLSARVKSLTLNYSGVMLDASAMGHTTKVNLSGLIDWSLNVEFEEEFAAAGSNSVDVTLFPLVGAAAIALVFKPANAAVGATNPSYTGNAVLQTYPIGGRHGDLLTTSVVFQCAGTLTRATA